jgi:hypothetical protein
MIKLISVFILPICLLMTITSSALGYPVTDEGKVVTILLTLHQPEVPKDVRTKLIDNSIKWVSGISERADTKVLVVRDNNHHNEYAEDTVKIANIMRKLGYRTRYINEPCGGLRYSFIKHYDAVWFSNPGWPIDHRASVDALKRYYKSGGGVILQGDDISWGYRGITRELRTLNHLRFENNGTRYGGYYTDNRSGTFYTVTTTTDNHPVLHGIKGITFHYGDDIDTTAPTNTGEKILAWATVSGKTCKKPVISAYGDIDDTQPVPEPATVFLIGTGVAVIIARKGKK